MRKFDYRAPRYPVNLPVRLTLDDAIYIGRCTEISVEGMKFQLDQSFEPGVTGLVRFSEKGITIDLPVRICYCGPDHAGMKFLCNSDEERGEIARFVSVCAGPRFHSSQLAAW